MWPKNLCWSNNNASQNSRLGAIIAAKSAAVPMLICVNLEFAGYASVNSPIKEKFPALPNLVGKLAVRKEVSFYGSN